MKDPFELYELKINNHTVKTPVVLASMAGITDAAYVLERIENCGLAFIGGYSIDLPTINASEEIASMGRSEFVTDEPIPVIKEEIAKLKDNNVIIGVNLRGGDLTSFVNLFNELGSDIVYEIDAHCRQEAMLKAGAGESLLKDTERLAAIIKALSSLGATVSVKIRAGVADDDSELTRIIAKAGAKIIHVDLMDYGIEKLRKIRNSSDLIVIANNSINDMERVKELFSHGADMISLARHADNETLKTLKTGIEELALDVGWYNAPKQLCRGGDIRSLAFCCMPIKTCPLMPWLKQFDITPKEYLDLKLKSSEGTRLSVGESTCFGSIAWCCKSSTPCLLRQTALNRAQITDESYMKMKQHLSQKILHGIFHKEELEAEDAEKSDNEI